MRMGTFVNLCFYMPTPFILHTCIFDISLNSQTFQVFACFENSKMLNIASHTHIIHRDGNEGAFSFHPEVETREHFQRRTWNKVALFINTKVWICTSHQPKAFSIIRPKQGCLFNPAVVVINVVYFKNLHYSFSFTTY